MNLVNSFMFVKLKTLKFKNVLSYGNYISEFDFTKGMNLISAKNGSGKTTILEALSFCLFGKPYRDIKIAELVNRKNRKGLYTEISFDIDSDNYEITRTLSPSKLS